MHSTMFIATLIAIAKTWKQSKCPSTDEWIKKLWYIYEMKYYSAIKKNETQKVPYIRTVPFQKHVCKSNKVSLGTQLTQFAI